MAYYENDRFRILAETTRDIVLTCDGEGRVTFVNRAGLDFLGRAADGSSGMSIGDILPPDEVTALRHELRRVTGGRRSSPLRRALLRARTGERRLGELSCAVVPGGAADGEMLLQIRIIPGQRLEEVERPAGEGVADLVTAVSDLSAFSRSVSHDLRAPLRTIEGAASILDGSHALELDAEGRALLRIIKKNAGDMARLIDDLLAFSRVGHQRLEKVQIDMNELVGAVFEGLDPAAAGRAVSFDVSPLPPAEGDPWLVRQLLVNLLSNALKFTRPRQEAVIHVGARIGSGEKVYFVSDNGVGFDMTYAGKLFGVFQRLHHKDEFEGSGVGLAIARRIVARHGGQIWAEGEPGKGATFYFTL